jgi:hypothetical protein
MWGTHKNFENWMNIELINYKNKVFRVSFFLGHSVLLLTRSIMSFLSLLGFTGFGISIRVEHLLSWNGPYLQKIIFKYVKEA